MAEAFGSGGDGGGGPRKMGVYDQPAQKSPIAKLLPLLIALAVLGALAYYFLRPRPAAETAGGGADTTMSAPASRDGSMGAGGGTASPPGPRGAQ